jgi:type IV pilus assembly protein PilQ
MKKGFFHTICKAAVLVVGFFCLGLNAAEMTGINFQQKGEISELELIFDTNEVEASRFHVPEDKQIILELKNVYAPDKVVRAFDTSEFSGAVVFVSAYKKPNNTKDMRVALQLRDNVRSALKRRENRVVLEIENRYGVFNQKQVENAQSPEEKIAESTAEAGKFHVPKSDSVEDILENLTLSGRKKYIGKKISLNVKDVAVEDILKMISEASGFNMILTTEVKQLPPLTLNLTNTPWDQTLDTILSLNKLVARKNGIILMVQTLDSATKEQEEEAKAKSLTVRQEPLVTKVFPISYAGTKELAKILEEYVTKERGKISEDERTNALIVKDTADVIEKMRKIIEVLDTQTPQVLIESKIVEVNESYAKEIGLREGLNFGYDPVGSIGDLGPSVVGDQLQAGTNGGPGFSFSSAPANTGDSVRSVFGLSVSRFSRLINLNFSLQLMETESKGKVLSSPKVITQNKKKAKLASKKTDSFRKVEGSGEDQTITFEEVSATLNLEVTPQITNEGSIVLEIQIDKEDFGERPFPDAPPKKTGNNIQTNVLVDNGSTVVLGGLYEYSKREQHSGVPFLKDIPLIGWLFRTPYAPETTKREMIIFLTPRIINQEEAGLIDKV